MSNLDGYWLVTVRTHGHSIVLAHWDTRPSAPRPAVPHSHLMLIVHQPVFMLSWLYTECQARKRWVSILQSLGWLDQGSKSKGQDFSPCGSDSLIFQHGRWALYSFSHQFALDIKMKCVIRCVWPCSQYMVRCWLQAALVCTHVDVVGKIWNEKTSQDGRMRWEFSFRSKDSKP